LFEDENDLQMKNDYLNLDDKMIFMGASLMHTMYLHTTMGHEDSYIELYNNL
jgi:hypothetical protein